MQDKQPNRLLLLYAEPFGGPAAWHAAIPSLRSFCCYCGYGTKLTVATVSGLTGMCLCKLGDELIVYLFEGAVAGLACLL